MTIEADWFVPSRIINVHVVGTPDINAIESFADILHNMMHEGMPPIHILLEDTDGGKPPIRQLHKLKSTLEMFKHDAFGWVVAVGETNDSVNFIFPMMLQILRIDYQRFETREEALAFLDEQDPTLRIS